MFINRETDYALRILRSLSDGQQRSAPEICTRELIPQSFAYKILKKLASAKILTVSRGNNGGCRLARELTDISLFDVMRAVDPDAALNECMAAGKVCQWRSKNDGFCHIHHRLCRLQQELDDKMRQLSVFDLLFTD